MAVVVVLVILAAVSLGIAGYVQKRMGTQLARTQISAIMSALDNYRADFGYYPPTTPVRISAMLLAESTNNAILYDALFNHDKRCLVGFPVSQLKTNGDCNAMNILDPFGTPFNYYNSPASPFALSTSSNPYSGCVTGGQVNVTSFDLSSYGPDHVTFVATKINGPTSGNNVSLPWTTPGWKLKSGANDDINNWSQ